MRRVVVLVAALILGVACGLATTAVSAYLRAPTGKRLGIPPSAAGHSQPPSAAGSSRQAELTGPGPATTLGGGAWSESVALSAGGSTALVGAPGRNAVYVFTLRGGTWSRTGELTASGSSVALSAGGSTALVGAPGRNSFAGAVYVFTLRGGTWSQAAELTASDAAADDQFGHSVALSAGGSTALVGAPGHDKHAGAVYVFTLRGGTWSQTGELTASDAKADNWFGQSVALSAGGGTALVGANGHDAFAGGAYVFTLRGGTWSQTAELTASGAVSSGFGWSVALSAGGGTALVGAFENHYLAGAGYVFTLRGGIWSQTAELTASDAAPNAVFGTSVALSAGGGTALVGAPGHDKGTGAGYVFTLRGGTWSQTAELTASGAAPGNQVGGSVALSALGGTALVGAVGYNLRVVTGYVFVPGGDG